MQLLRRAIDSGADVTAVNPDVIDLAKSRSGSGAGKTEMIHYRQGPFPPRLLCKYRYAQSGQWIRTPPLTFPQWPATVTVGNGMATCNVTYPGNAPVAGTDPAWWLETQAYLSYNVRAAKQTLTVEYMDAQYVQTAPGPAFQVCVYDANDSTSSDES